MILAVLKMKIPLPQTEGVLQALRLLMRPARSQKGFIACELDLEADDANVVRYEERWSTREDLEAQLRSPRYTQLLAVMESATERPMLEFQFVNETRGLDYVAASRGE